MVNLVPDVITDPTKTAHIDPVDALDVGNWSLDILSLVGHGAWWISKVAFLTVLGIPS